MRDLALPQDLETQTFVHAATSSKARQAEHLASDLARTLTLPTRLAKIQHGPHVGVSSFRQVFAKEPDSDAGLNEIISCAGHGQPLLLRVCM